MARAPRWTASVSAASDEACLATRLYNDPGEVRSFESFIIHMHLAWLYLLQAEYERDGVDTRVRDKTRPRRFVKIDGEAKRWDLASCVKHRWPNADGPVRANIEFFIALRNKIEHRYSRFQTALMLATAGHAQALLLNFEQELTAQFGDRLSLASRLRFPIFIGTFTEPGVHALQVLHASLPKAMRTFIADYHAGLDASVQEDSRFALRLRVTLEMAGKGADVPAIQFTRLDDMTPEQRVAVEEMGRTGQVIIREQKRPVQHLNWCKPREATTAVAVQIPFRFNSFHFTRAWRALNVRPAPGAALPERTDERYCVYDQAHRDYIYSPAYVQLLVKKLSTADGFAAVMGIEPQER